MIEPVTDLDTVHVRSNLERIREQAGPEIEVLAATKYVPLEEMAALADAGVELVGENRLQDLEEKRERWGDRFTWDFIGNLQSRKVKRILPLVRLIHSVATDSVLEQLGRHGGADTEVLVEVDLSGEEGKGGIEPARTGRSRWRRGRRSFAWAPCFGHNRSTRPGGITAVKPNLSRDGDQRHMETGTRVFRPR